MTMRAPFVPHWVLHWEFNSQEIWRTSVSGHPVAPFFIIGPAEYAMSKEPGKIIQGSKNTLHNFQENTICTTTHNLFLCFFHTTSDRATSFRG